MPSLFDEMHIGNMTARNRIVRAATTESLATKQGCLTPELLGLYGQLAWGGAGTIITGYMYVTPEGKPSEGALGLYDDAFLHHYRCLADLAHENGACIVAQLVYGGSKSKLSPDDERRITSVDEPCENGTPNVTILGASAIENPRTHLVPTEATTADLETLAEAFGKAAIRARACGFDGVEVHAAHGYLLSQFLSPSFNRRTDEYGGSVENRARLATQCVNAIRSEVGADYPLLVKLNSCERFHDPMGAEGGLSEDESAHVAALLVKAGANGIDVSGDWHAASASASAGQPYFAGFGARLARELSAPVIVTGGWRDPLVAEEHIQRDGITGRAMSRPLICEPGLPRRWQSGDMTPSKCISCGTCQQQVGIPCAIQQ